MKDLLKSLSTLSEGETKDTKTGRVHKGSYGSEYETDKEGNEVKKAAPAAAKKGRGRPKKDDGEGTKFDSSALNNVFGGKKPSKAVGKVSKKHSLKEYIESSEQMKRFETVMEGMFGSVDHSSVAANLGKLAKVIRSVQTPEQFAVAQKYAQRMSGTIMKHQHDNSGFGSGLRANLGVMRAISSDLKAKAEELGVPYDPLAEADQVEIKPASQTQTQVIQQGNKTLGTVSNPQLANQIKQAIGQGQMSLNSDEQTMAEGKAKPDFKDVDKDGNKKESWKKAEKDKKKVDESRDFAASEYTDEQVGKILAREKPGMDTNSDDFYSAVYHELIQMGLTPKAARYKLNVDEDFMGDVASAYSHFQSNPTLDEGSIEDHTQHGLDAKPSKFVAVDPKQAPTPWKRDPIQAATDRAFDFVSSLKQKSPFSEGTDMKDIQLESWESQLKGLLNEGITVSSSQGQQGSPDSVSVTATEGDADALLSVLRNAGIGGFGAEPQAPEIGYGVAQGGEEQEFDGTGTQPQPSPEVVGDDGDMLSMLKKMAGLSGGDAEVVAVSGGDEEGQDYEDEEGQEGGEEQAQTLEPATGNDEEGSEESGEESEEADDEEEQTDEGNAFGQEVRQKKSDNIPNSQQRITTGGQNLPVKEEGEETCNECGMMESQCECEHEHVEENFANEPGHGTEEQELAKLKALLSMGNDMHRMKQSQAMGNPVRVAEADVLNQWKKLSGI